MLQTNQILYKFCKSSYIKILGTLYYIPMNSYIFLYFIKYGDKSSVVEVKVKMIYEDLYIINSL